MMLDENPVDFRDRHEVEDYLIFIVGCAVTVGIVSNLLAIILVIYAN